MSETYGCPLVICDAPSDACDLFYRKTVSDQENPVMIPGHCIFPRRLGMILAHSRNKYVRCSS